MNKRNNDGLFNFGITKLSKTSDSSGNTQMEGISDQSDNNGENSTSIPEINPNNDRNENASWAEMIDADTSSGAKVTPIQLRHYDRDGTIKIREKLNSKFAGGFVWRQLNQNYLARIYPTNEDLKMKIVQFLSVNNVEFNSFTYKTNRRRGYIVLGLCARNDDAHIDDIYSTLTSHGIMGQIQIKRFTTGDMKRNPERASALFSIIADPEVADQNICQIRRIGSFHVIIEKMKKSSVIQCHRCQRFNHTASQCNFKFRCVQCVEIHPPGNCPRKLNSKLPMACIHCQTAGITQYSGHTANNHLQCHYYNKYQIKSGESGGKSNVNPAEKTKSRQNTDRFGLKNVNTSRQQSNHHQTYRNLDADMVANNPGITGKSKKLRRVINKYRPSVAGKSIQPSTAIAPKKSEANKMGGLIAALMQVLQEFT